MRRKFCPDPQDIRSSMLWMHENRITATQPRGHQPAVEHFARFKGIKVALGRPRKPKRIVQHVLSAFRSFPHHPMRPRTPASGQSSLCSPIGVRNTELCSIRRKDIDLGTNQRNPRRQGQKGSRRERLRRMHQSVDRLPRHLSQATGRLPVHDFKAASPAYGNRPSQAVRVRAPRQHRQARASAFVAALLATTCSIAVRRSS